jgi:hypothetical protein
LALIREEVIEEFCLLSTAKDRFNFAYCQAFDNDGDNEVGPAWKSATFILEHPTCVDEDGFTGLEMALGPRIVAELYEYWVQVLTSPGAGRVRVHWIMPGPEILSRSKISYGITLRNRCMKRI